MYAVAALSLHEASAVTVFPIATNPSVVEISGPVLFDGTNYMAGLTSGTNVSVQRFSATGELLGSRLDVGANPGFPPAATFASSLTHHLAAWTDATASDITIFGQLLSRSGAPISSNFPLLQSAGSHGPQVLSGLASDGTNFLVVWLNEKEELYGQLVTLAETLSGPEFQISGPQQEVAFAAVTFGQTNYLVAWQGSEPDQDNETFGAFVSLSGFVDSPFLISESASPSFNPLAVGFDGTNYLVVWNHDIGPGFPAPTDWDLYGRTVASDGSFPGNEVVLVGDDTSELLPSLAFDGSNYLLAWTDDLFNGTNYGIRFRFFDRSGSPVESSFTVFTNQGTNVPLITLNGLLYDGVQFVAAATLGTVQTNASGRVIGFRSGDVYGAFIPKSGGTSTSTYTVLKRFTGNDGGSPRALTLSGSSLYGTTTVGGSSNHGTVFKLITDGTGFAVLKHFTGSDGRVPQALTFSGTTLYGTTTFGGGSDFGTVFKLNTDGTAYTVLKHFTGSDGRSPQGLTLSGNTLYGTTSLGGSSGFGTVFKLNADGTGYTVLKHFTGNDGGSPRGLTLSGSSFYGPASVGGSSNHGTVFKLNMDGTGFAVLKHFTDIDGKVPSARLTVSGSSLYGTTYEGGSSDLGTVFKVNTDGTSFTVLKHFTSSEGRNPGGLTLSGSTLFGTTYSGGNSNYGTVFPLDVDGMGYTMLKQFTGSDGRSPQELTLSGSTLYGITSLGGSSDYGTVFKLELGGSVPKLSLQLLGNQFVLSWADLAFCLQTAPEVTGIWTNIPSATSPYTNVTITTEPRRFFRLIRE